MPALDVAMNRLLAAMSRRRIFAIAAICGTFSACGRPKDDGQLPVELLGDWSALKVFNDDGDTLLYRGPRPALHLGRNGSFTEQRSGEVVSRGSVLRECDELGHDETNGLCLHFLTPSELLHVEQYWLAVLHRDTLVLQSLETDGWHHILVRQGAR